MTVGQGQVGRDVSSVRHSGRVHVGLSLPAEGTGERRLSAGYGKGGHAGRNVCQPGRGGHADGCPVIRKGGRRLRGSLYR